MIYQWLFDFSDNYSFFYVFRYITFRSFLSFITAFIICLVLGPSLIQKLNYKKIKQKIKIFIPEGHKKKIGIPTSGGLLIFLSIFTTSFFWFELSNPLVLSAFIIFLSFALVGYLDDRVLLYSQSGKGLSGKIRLCFEFLITIAILSSLYTSDHLNTNLYVPFLKDVEWSLGWLYIIFGSFVIVGSANAVNLTDGLDGLAIFPVIICSLTLGIFSYLSGHFNLASYLGIPFIEGSGELAPFCLAVAAGGLGFLWFNAYPAQVFMGDTGSLSLGAFLGTVAVFSKNELLLILLGGLFVVETVSVILQVLSFQLTGKRLFKMAPLHHHFELKGFPENKIIVRFWIVSILLAVLSLSTLKLR